MACWLDTTCRADTVLRTTRRLQAVGTFGTAACSTMPRSRRTGCRCRTTRNGRLTDGRHSGKPSNVQGDRRCAASSRSVQRAKRTGSTAGLGVWFEHAGRKRYVGAPARKPHCDADERRNCRPKLHSLNESRRWRYGDHGAQTKEGSQSFRFHRRVDAG